MTNLMLTTELAGPGFIWFYLLLVIWTLIWKGWSLWIAARKESKPWFISLLVINTLGILEILYIFWISKKDWEEDSKKGMIDIEAITEAEKLNK